MTRSPFSPASSTGQGNQRAAASLWCRGELQNERSACVCSSVTVGKGYSFSIVPFILGWNRMAISEKAVAPHSSTLAWKIPWTEEPGGLQSMGSRRVGHDWATSLSLLCIGEGNGNPLQCSCLENPRDGVTQSQTRLKWLSRSSRVAIAKKVSVVKVPIFWASN